MGSAKRAVLKGCFIGAVVVVAGCSSGGSSTTANTRPRTTTPTAAKVKSVQVNLMLSGDRAAALVGTEGSCVIPPFGAPTYEFKGSDYPTRTVRASGRRAHRQRRGRYRRPQVTIGDVGLPTAPASP
jgi:hypothetical protein